ncbi:MAG: hypothetical protein JXB50_00095 [Spirochaetes bacterium]|nr:hypothetical protein [Spirochaetota bacterium]
MFIGINLDFASTDSKNAVLKILNEYGIKKTHDNLYESFDFPAIRLGNLKRDITNNVDMDDNIRLYQFPLEGTFKISSLQDGKWKRLSIKPS